MSDRYRHVTKPVQIVTGAPNVFEGAYVPVALDGSRIPGPIHDQPKEEGGTVITKGKLRGVESNGMLCSFGELGFEDKVVPVNQKDGIWILDSEYPVGTDFAETMELKDAIIDFEITPNRPDCLSMIGMAREAAATFGTKLKYPETECEHEEGDAKDYIEVEVKSPLCRTLCRQSRQGRQGGGLSVVAAEEIDPRGDATDQQYRRHHQLRHAGIRAAAARLRH